MKLHTIAALVALLVLPTPAQPATEPLGIGLEGYPYPFPVHFLPFQIERQDMRMTYMDVAAQAAANGRTVVLMHGKNFGGYYWAGVIRALSAAGYRVVVPDQIGWGRSSKPDIHYSFHLLAANTARLLDTLGIRQAAVVGHSTGGILAVRFALMYPERVTELILEDALGMEDYRVGPPQSDEDLYRNELRNTDPEHIRAFFARYFVNPKPEVYEPLAEVPIRVAESGEFARWAKASALAYQMIYQQPVRSEYPLIQPRTLFVVGDKDRTAILAPSAPPELREKMGHYPELARQAAKEIGHASVVVVPECGHIPHLEHPEVFYQALLGFLAAR
jgi:pimeloyl-ACP methyl ester carboxylesterase